MTPGLRSYKSATLRVAIAEGIPEHMRPRVRELLSVHAAERQKGHGSALLERTCREADRKQMVLLITPRRFDDGMDDAALIPWYERFGFEVIQEEPVLMAREPHH